MKKVVIFTAVILLVVVSFAIVVSEVDRTEKCRILKYENELDNQQTVDAHVSVKTEKDEIHLNNSIDNKFGVDNWRKLTDIEWLNKNEFLISWNQMKHPSLKRLGVQVGNLYKWYGDTSVDKQNIFRWYSSSTSSSMNLKVSGDLLLTQLEGRGMNLNNFYSLQKRSQEVPILNSNATWIVPCCGGEFIFSGGPSGLLINNTLVKSKLSEKIDGFKHFNQKNIESFKNAFWVLAGPKLYRIRPKLSVKPAQKSVLSISKEKLNHSETDGNNLFTDLNKTWQKTVQTNIQMVNSLDERLNNLSLRRPKLVLRRSLNRLYLLAYQNNGNPRTDEPIELYRVNEDGTVRTVQKNRDIKMKGLKHGDRRMYCEDETMLKLWGYEWKNPPIWIIGLVA